MVEEILQETENQMKKAVEALRHNLATIRTGRASTGLVDHISVEAYGSIMPLYQLATIGIPDSHSIVIQPYDAGTIRAIEKAIQQSDLGLTPQDDGRVVRLNLPALNEERRRELVKLVRSRLEDVKVSVRNHRREALDDMRQLESEKMIGEDELHRVQDRIQQLTDRFIKELEQVGATKEAEVMEV